MKKLYESLRELAMQMINFLEKDNEAINKRTAGIIEKTVIFVNKNLKINIWKMKNIIKLEIIVIIQGNIEVLRIAYVI